jgi:hypothetical protein
MKQYMSLIMFFFLAYQSYSQEKIIESAAASAVIQQTVNKGEAGPSAVIRIRCRTSISSDDAPLYVVDGILYEAYGISQLNPSEIIEIQILKAPIAETLYGCRAMRGVIIITTKKAHQRKFIIRDAKNMLVVSNATIEAKSVKTGKISYFVADAFGRFETDSLKTTDYVLTISSTGYKTSELSLKSILQNKGEIKLEPAFVELEEVVITGKVISCRRTISTCGHNVTSCGMFTCSVKGVVIEKEKRPGDIAPYKTRGLDVYPNPVAASATINISFPNIKPGECQIRLLNAAGQLFYSFQKQIAVKGETVQIHLNGKTLPGMYIVQVIDDQKRLLQSSKIVVQ